MESTTKPEVIHPPKLFETLTNGFNTVTNNIHLILFPIGLDSLLWLGPRLRVKTLLEPIIRNLTDSVDGLATPEIGSIGQWTKDVWEIILTNFNLFSLVRSFPIGVPSIMSGFFSIDTSVDTPIGVPMLLEVNSIIEILILGFLFFSIGIILGCFYFDSISRATDKEISTFSISDFGSSIFQIFIFTGYFVLAFILFIIPLIMIISVLALISPALGEISLLFASIILIWLGMPLAFAPHGVFAKGESILTSSTSSIRLIRNYLPGAGLFFLIALLLYQGLNVLWETPPQTSWMTVVGIFGHAFIGTGLITSSFIYYRNGIAWMESKQQQAAVQP